MMAPVANWASSCDNHVTRPLMEKTMGVDRNAELPQFTANTLVNRAKSEVPEINTKAPAYGRKAVLYATCFGNFNNPEIGIAARQILARNGVETEVVYPSCCGMPQMEQGDIAQVAKNAATVAAEIAFDCGATLLCGSDLVRPRLEDCNSWECGSTESFWAMGVSWSSVCC